MHREKGDFSSFIIDFGKSKYQSNVQGYKRTTDSDYIPYKMFKVICIQTFNRVYPMYT